jgi:N utilization substance protein B
VNDDLPSSTAAAADSTAEQPTAAVEQKKPTEAVRLAGTRKSSQKSPRSRAREFVLQGLYQFIVSGNDPEAIDAFTRDLQGFNKVDQALYNTLLHGCINTHEELDALIKPLLDRPMIQISPIERGCMWLGAYELAHRPTVPWRVILNESIELAKDFGGADGYKYVNAVLSGVAQNTRASEVSTDRGSHK